MTDAPPNPDLSGVRRALRERDVKVLGALVASQLVAHRCSTVYGPSAALLRQILDDEALPRLEALHDVRRVVVHRWPAGGPTLAQLHGELLRQLELAPPVDPAPPTAPGPVDLAALVQVVERAYRVSDRPLVIVLHDLEHLLDDGRDRGVDRKFVDALATLVDLPIRGLQLAMAVQERDLGAFRHLLRGHQRLLANDLRLHSDDRRIPIPVGIVTGGATTAVAGTTAAAAAAGKTGLAALVAGGALAAAGLVLALVGRDALQDARDVRDSAPPPIECPACPACRECPGPAVDPDPTPPPDVAPDPDVEPDVPGEPDPPADPNKQPNPDAIEPVAPNVHKFVDVKPAACVVKKTDGACARCTRDSCCKDLQACRSAKSKNCVLQGKVPSDACTPEAIEKDCRPLALCALEYKCNAVCFSDYKP